MPHIIGTESFKFAHHGHQVQEFSADLQPVEVTEDCAALAVGEGWAQIYREPDTTTVSDVDPGPPPSTVQLQDAPAEEQALPEAPANKDAAPKRSTKTAAAA